jgi:hypothetical protein
MAWLLLVGIGVLALLVLALAVLTVRLSGRIGALEHRLAAQSPSSDTRRPSGQAPDDHTMSLDDGPRAAPEPEYVITHLGEPEPEPAPVPTVAAPVFADIVLRETVVQTASLFHGLRRALAPESRNRIRFHMRQEVKRSRKQRRTELREVRREWAARQRAATPHDQTIKPAPQDTAA